jgi:hypothetical protein
VNDALEDGEERYNVTTKRQFKVLDIMNDNVEKIKVLCKECERDMPTEMKLIYDSKSGKLQAEYKYDLMYTNDDVKTANDIADEWFKDIKSGKLRK